MDTLTKIVIALVLLITGILLFFLFKPSPAESVDYPGSGPNSINNPAVSSIYNLSGDWMGTLAAGGAELRLVFHLHQDEDGDLSGTWDSVDQAALGLPISSAEVDGNSLVLELRASSARFEGTINQAGTEIVGTWIQLGNELPLTLRPQTEAINIERPQEPIPPFPYEAQEVKFSNSDAGIELAGTLTLPEGDGPFPAVVLISGSGPQDRNEELLGHKPFLVISDYLTRQGIAVLRYDDRGFGESSGEFSTATTEDFATDAWAAVQYLQTRNEIDNSNIGLIGHSEGGLVAPIVAAEHSEVAFIILLAGPGVPGAEVIIAQSEAAQRALGIQGDVIELTKSFNEQVFSIVLSESVDDVAQAKIMEVIEALSDEDRQRLGISNEAVAQQISQWTSDWFRFFLAYDPAPTLERVSVPVLVLNGSKDLQVLATQNLGPIEEALKRGGNTQYEIIEYDNLNHLFQHSETGAPTEYGQIEETFAPHVLEKMGRWILERVSSDQ